MSTAGTVLLERRPQPAVVHDPDRIGRAVLDAVRLHLRGAGRHAVVDAIHGHPTYAGAGGRAAWARRLQSLKGEMPQYAAVLDRIAVHVMTCP
ncbi:MULTISPECIES: hypothetical protein [Catenuloplanes]|uniref:Uncharacterized protein n=1 Tax=Catenuloplanes niger TaxID=587534 RepID=A0AAE3ZTR1_9ACTN|nr:hypothetical protein [Catenuloplanes niger]MDR7325908.1 hypothetical protein [Catenuloplanes niger]